MGKAKADMVAKDGGDEAQQREAAYRTWSNVKEPFFLGASLLWGLGTVGQEEKVPCWLGAEGGGGGGCAQQSSMGCLMSVWCCC